VALDEPDGVAGALAVQQTPPSLAQQILAFESIGKIWIITLLLLCVYR